MREVEAAMRRALMRVKPDYLSWDRQTQDEYNVTMPDEDDFRIRQTVLKSLFQIEVSTKDQMEAALADFDNARYALFNSAMLPVQGIGDDCFLLSEYLGDKTLLDFNTLYDYDLADHQFQEESRKADSPDYIPKPYRGRLHYTWARLRIDGQFYYANLCMAAGYAVSTIEEAGEKYISQLIPHEYVPGKENGKREGHGSIFDMRLSAGGLEGQLDELKRRFSRYIFGAHEKLPRSARQKLPGILN